MLYLENNSLRKLPDQLFTSLRLLQWLDVRNNQLKKLPVTIKHHPCLETILLDGNLFEELPLELCTKIEDFFKSPRVSMSASINLIILSGLLSNLKELQASRNPLNFPPADILALGFAATIRYLRNEWNKLHPEEAVESPERKTIS